MEFVSHTVGKYFAPLSASVCWYLFAGIYPEVVSARSFLTNLLGDLCLILVMH